MQKKKYIVYKSKYNNKGKKQGILLMIGDDHYLAVTNLSGLLQGNSSNHRGDFYCLNCFNSYTTKNKLKEREEICNNHGSCRIEMPDWVNKTIKYNPGEKPLKAPFSFFLDLECILKNYNLVKTTQKNLMQKKKLDMSLLVGHYIQDVHLIKTKISLITIEEKDCIEELCKKLKENAMEIINHEKKRNNTINP